MEWAPFERAFVQPFVTGGQTWLKRCGILLRHNGVVGEASPLPGFSRDTLAQVEAVLKLESVSSLMELGNEQQLPPSLQFAFESLFASAGDQEVKSNAVFSLDDQRFSQAFEQGYRTFKIKVSPQYFPVALLQQWSERVNLRLDANGSFSAQEFTEAQKTVKVEYWEDPIKDPRQIISPQVPVALDQYVDCWDRVQEVLQMPAITHLVLKPTVLGGLRVTESAIRACLAAGKKFTVTSSLEAEPGRRAILQMMSKIPGGGTSGLSTGKIFVSDFLSDMPNYRLPFVVSHSEQDWLNSLDWRKIRP